MNYFGFFLIYTISAMPEFKKLFGRARGLYDEGTYKDEHLLE